MAEKSPNTEDGGRVKRQKTENMDRSRFYFQGMNDSEEGGVSLFPSTSKPVKAESNRHGATKPESEDHDDGQKHSKAENSDDSDTYLQGMNDDDGGVPLYGSVNSSVKHEHTKKRGEHPFIIYIF